MGRSVETIPDQQLIQKLALLEPIVASEARGFSGSIVQHDVEDLKQIGRMALVEAILQKGETVEAAYYRQCVRNAFLSLFRSENTQKRRPDKFAQSIDAPIGDEDGSTLHEVIAAPEKDDTVSDNEILDHIKQGPDSGNVILDRIRKKYGKKYIMDLSKDVAHPKILFREILRKIILEESGYTPEDAFINLDHRWFAERGLLYLIQVFYGASVYDMMIDLFGNAVKNPYARYLPPGFWKGAMGVKRAKAAIEWFVKVKGIKTVADCADIRRSDFEGDIGLYGMIQTHFRNSPYLALQVVFPELKPWQANQVRGAFKDLDMRLLALDAYCVQYIGTSIQDMTPEEVYERGIRMQVSGNRLRKFGLRAILEQCDRSPYEVFKRHYPDQILAWFMERKYRTNEDPRATARQALKWLFERYLLLTPKELPSIVTNKLICHMGFHGIMTDKRIGLRGSPFEAVNLVYPGKFTHDDFPRGSNKRIDSQLSRYLDKPRIKKRGIDMSK